MDAFFERLVVRAAAMDEILSWQDESPAAGAGGDDALAKRRVAAWCQASANGDWALFQRRLSRDGLSYEAVLAQFAAFRSRTLPTPAWLDDARWIDAALHRAAAGPSRGFPDDESYAFECLLAPVVTDAEIRLWEATGTARRDDFTDTGRGSLVRMLFDQLSELCAPALYERFSAVRADATTDTADKSSTRIYDRFVTDMKAAGFRRLFEEKPVLLRLMAVLTRQWIDTIAEFVTRLQTDRELIRHDFAKPDRDARVSRIDGGLSDRHNGGRSVLIVTFEDGARLVYKPKDLRLDVAWQRLVARLNASAAPEELRAVRTISRPGYGWTEFIEHAGCKDGNEVERFFRRAGALLALLHCFAATDMHQENIIAAGDQPVPIDLETILQAAPTAKIHDADSAAWDAAADKISTSVMAVGMLPAYGRAPDTSVFAMGAMTADWNTKIKISWIDANTDTMRPTRIKVVDRTNPNLPHVSGRYARFGDHAAAFIAGFEDYARFLSGSEHDPKDLFAGFSDATLRRVVRPTRFYAMLLQRLKSPKTMDDGVVWSAQADFIARLSDWDRAGDPDWPFHRAERSALLDLNIPHFVLPSDGHEARDFRAEVVTLSGPSGLDRARARMRDFDETEIVWQSDVIRANMAKPPSPAVLEARPARVQQAEADPFAREADRIADELTRHAIRRGPSAAWIGLDWMGDAEAFQLTPLGPDLYNGNAGMAVFLAAHAGVTGRAASAELALAALALIRKKLKDSNAARFARSLGIGGATGLGSLVYALTTISRSLGNESVLADAHAAAALITDDLIGADKRLDALGGSAGAILGLLRLYRESLADDVLARAVRCGEHLLGHDRVGPEGRRTWVGQGLGSHALNGMSHGAAGFAYALASLAAETGRDDFQAAASEALAFEDSHYDTVRNNWPDLRHDGEPGWACRWCHGAPGIGLARAGLLKRTGMERKPLRTDIENAIAGVERAWPSELDTLCCGTLGSVEFLCEAADALERPELRQQAGHRLNAIVQASRSPGDYRWNTGERRFNLGLFRGLAGVGYTLLRQRDPSLPNLLIWE